MNDSPSTNENIGDLSFTTDVLIVGGGMVGMSLALLLAKACVSKKITLLDSHPIQSNSALYQPSFDARSTAISADSVSILQSLNIWSEVSKHATSIDVVHVSDRGHIGSTRYAREQNNGQALGYVVDNAWFGRCLTDAVLAQENIDVLGRTQAEKPTIHQDYVSLELVSDSKSGLAQAQLLVVADGAQSRLRKALGIGKHEHDYHQHAVIANVKTELAHKGVAYERFTRSGPMALLPRGGNPSANSSALVWTTPEEDIASVMQWDDETFLSELQQVFGFRLGRFLEVGERQHYPLKKIFAAEQVRQRVVLMGNAAHFLHPVAGQGFNLALRDSQKLVEVLAMANHDIGCLNVLQKYMDIQDSDQWLTTALSHNFNHIFSSEKKALQGARNLGLLLLNQFLPVKQGFFQQMMGRGPRF